MSPAGWWHLLAVLAAEAGIVVCATALLCRWCCPAWQRTLWHAALVMLLGFALIENFGLTWGFHARPKAGWSSSKTKAESKETQAPVEMVPLVVQVPTEVLALAPERNPVMANRKLTWWPAWVWMAGAVLLLCRSSGVRVWFLVRCRRRRNLTDQDLLTVVNGVAKTLGIRNRFRVSESALLAGPIAFGVFRPEILLPSGFSQTFTHSQVEAILAHELEHLRAHDPFWYSVCDVASAVWWWNPLVWYLRSKLQTATEQAADEASLLIENGPSSLAECLVAMGKKLAQAPAFNRLGIEGNGYRSGLGRRVTRLLQFDSKSRLILLKAGKRWITYAGSLLVLIFCVLAGGAWRSRERPLASTAWEALQQHPESSSNTKAKVENNKQEIIVPEKPGLYPPVKISTNGLEERFPNAKFGPDGLPPIGVNELYLQLDPTTGFITGTNSPLQTRWFKLDTARLDELYPGSTNDSCMRILTNLLTSFAAEGLDLSPPKNVFYNDRLAMLMVRGTKADLKKVEKALNRMGLAVVASSSFDDDRLTRWFKVDPDRVTIAFSEAPGISKPELVFSNLLARFKNAGVDVVAYKDRDGMLMVRGTKENLQFIEDVMEEFKTVKVTRLQLKATMVDVAGGGPPDGIGIDQILTRKRAESMMKNAAKAGWTLVAESSVTVTNRGRALFKFKSPPGSRNPSAPIGSTNVVEILPELLVDPEVKSDGYTISLGFTQTIQQFVGYDLHAGPDGDYVPSSGANPPPRYLARDRTPTPIYHLRQETRRTTLWDGQTLFVRGLTGTNTAITNTSPRNKVPLLGDLPLAGRLFSTQSPPATERNLMVMITATIVDENGKPLHRAKDLSFSDNNVPPESNR